MGDATADLPFEDPTAALDAFVLDDLATDGAMDAEGLVAGAADGDPTTLAFTDSDHNEVVPFYRSDDYMMFQANQAYMNATLGTTNGVDWNLNGIVGY